WGRRSPGAGGCDRQCDPAPRDRSRRRWRRPGSRRSRCSRAGAMARSCGGGFWHPAAWASSLAQAYTRKPGGGNAVRFDKFTTKSQEALAEAQRLAERAGHPEVGTEHVLQALLDQKGGAVVPVLEAARVPTDHIRRALEQRFQSLPKVSGGRQTVLSPSVASMLEHAEVEAERLRDEYVSTEHFLLGEIDPAVTSEMGRILRSGGDPRERLSRAPERSRRRTGVDARSRGDLPGPHQVRARSDRGGAQGLARSGHRPRR